MPKVISRAAISSSADAPETATQQAVLRTYFCLCGEFLLVIDKDLQNLPRRPSDGAFIVRAKATEANPSAPTRVFKLNSVDGGKVFIKRGDGDDSGSGSSQLEPRYVHLCPRCATPTAYQATPLPATRASIVYLHYGGFTEQQGTVPAEAWEGEDAVVDEP